MTRTSKAIGTLAALTTIGAAMVSLPAQAEDNGRRVATDTPSIEGHRDVMDAMIELHAESAGEMDRRARGRTPTARNLSSAPDAWWTNIPVTRSSTTCSHSLNACRESIAG